jgi:hypothetical protein
LYSLNVVPHPGFPAEPGAAGGFFGTIQYSRQEHVSHATLRAPDLHGLLLTTEAMVADKPEKKEAAAPPGMPPGGYLLVPAYLLSSRNEALTYSDCVVSSPMSAMQRGTLEWPTERLHRARCFSS